MSTSEEESPAEIQYQANVNYFFTLLSLTILYYDYLLTVDWEVSRFWRHPKFTWASAFFYLNRYIGLFGHIPIAIEFFWTGFPANKTEICHKLQSYHQYLAVVVQVLVAIMLIMRTYALYERSRKVLVSLLAVTTAAIAFGCWAILTGGGGSVKEGDPPYIGCPSALSKDSATRLAAAWGGMLIFDTMIFSLTLYKALLFRRMGGVSLLTLILRDGTLYFGIMAASNLGNMLSFLLGGSRTRGVATTFTNIVSSVMISRLMLNLRDPRLWTPGSRGTGTTATTRGMGVVSTVIEFSNRGGTTGFSTTHSAWANMPRADDTDTWDGSTRRGDEPDEIEPDEIELVERGRQGTRFPDHLNDKS